VLYFNLIKHVSEASTLSVGLRVFVSNASWNHRLENAIYITYVKCLNQVNKLIKMYIKQELDEMEISMPSVKYWGFFAIPCSATCCP